MATAANARDPLRLLPARAAALPRPSRGSGWASVLALGLALGVLDLAFVSVFGLLRDDLPALRVAQSIAAWALGREAAFAGGATTALLGVALYGLTIAVIVAGYRGLAAIDDRWRRHPRVGGMVYGAVAYALLFEVAVPLWSAAPARALPLDWQVACLVGFAGLIGVPSARATGTRR